MKKQLTTILCEKPSQAADWAKFLRFAPSHKKRNHYLDPSRNIAIIHGVGHLFELAPPEHYVPELAKTWSLKSLPVFPDTHVVQLKTDMKSLFDVIKKVLGETETLMIGTDADNEGELIAWDIIQHSGYKGAVKRLLYSDTTAKSLDKAWSNPQPSDKTLFMAREADLRRRLDWLVGMNLTMALTTIMKAKGEIKNGAFSVGRVITSVAMIVYLNELARKSFVEQSYYLVKAKCRAGSGQEFIATLKYPEEYLDPKIGKCVNLKVAQSFADGIKGKEFVAAVESSEKSKKPPLPHDLSSLQSAVDKFGIDAKETLSLLQTLYDQPISGVTYPRTECRYLPEGMFEDAKQTLHHLNTNLKEVKRLEFDTTKMPSSFNDKKVNVHHGISPTVKTVALVRLSEKQAAIYLTIALRYVAQFMADYKYLSQKIRLSAGQVSLESSGIKVIGWGWKEAEKLLGRGPESDDDDDDAGSVINVEHGETVRVVSCEVVTEKTKKPGSLSTAQLVEEMKRPGRWVTDPTIAKHLNDGDGIGTSATRSDIIDRALSKHLFQKVGRGTAPTRLFEKHAGKFKKMDPGFTALLQRGIVAVAEGSLKESELFEQYQNYIQKVLKEWQSEKA